MLLISYQLGSSRSPWSVRTLFVALWCPISALARILSCRAWSFSPCSPCRDRQVAPLRSSRCHLARLLDVRRLAEPRLRLPRRCLRDSSMLLPPVRRFIRISYCTQTASGAMEDVPYRILPHSCGPFEVAEQMFGFRSAFRDRATAAHPQPHPSSKPAPPPTSSSPASDMVKLKIWLEGNLWPPILLKDQLPRQCLSAMLHEK